MNNKEIIKLIEENFPVEKLSSLKFDIDGFIDKKTREAIQEVTVVKIKGKSFNTYNLSYNGMKIIAKPIAYAGRLKVFEAVPKKRGEGYKTGRVIIGEYYGDSRGLARSLRFNCLYNYDFNDDSTWDCNK